ncbi:hypothetical protein [Thalassospira lucentensis]
MLKTITFVAMFAFASSAYALDEMNLRFDGSITGDQRVKAMKIFAELTDTGCSNIIKYQDSIDNITFSSYEEELNVADDSWGTGNPTTDYRFDEYGWTAAVTMDVRLKDGPDLHSDFQRQNGASSSFSIGTDGEKPGIVVFNDLSKASIVCGFAPMDEVREVGHRFAPIPELRGLFDQ